MHRKDTIEQHEDHNNTHRRAPAGIEKPLVMKSACFALPSVLDEKRLLMLSLFPVFRLLLRSCSSARTLAVNAAVAAFLIPVVFMLAFGSLGRGP